MRPAPAFPRGAAEKLKVALTRARTPEQVERVLCLWLRAALRLNAPLVAGAIGWTPNAVRRFQARYLRRGEAVLAGRGRGGHHRHLSAEAERDLLDRVRGQAKPGGIIKASAVHVAYEKAVGHTLPKSTVYRLLARHGWRKAAVGLVKARKKEPLVQVRGSPRAGRPR